MAFSDFLADRVRQYLQGKGGLEEKKMMGGLVFMLNGKMCVGVDVDKSDGSDRLMVRVGKDNFDELLGANGAKKMDFTGRPMKGYLFIDPEGFDTDEQLRFWLEHAVKFNSILIEKEGLKK